MIKLVTKCSCGCDEKHRGIEIGPLFALYFEDCGEWWFRIGHKNHYLSYSPCQGLWLCKMQNGKYGHRELW